jgi:hypothetical protein
MKVAEHQSKEHATHQTLIEGIALELTEQSERINDAKNTAIKNTTDEGKYTKMEQRIAQMEQIITRLQA